jgi:F-type H+-transporting ATPase subunit b
MRIDWWTLGLQAINAIVLIWLLGRFLFKPVAAIIAEREAAAAKVSADAEALRAAAAKEEASAQALEMSIAADRAAQLEAAADAAAKERERLIAEAHADADKLRAAAKDEIAQQHGELRHRADHRAARLAVAIAERLMTRLPGSDRIEPFLSAFADGIEALPPEARSGLADHARLRVACEPGPALRNRITVLLSDKLGTPVSPEIDVDATLIAGIELESQHAAVRNSLRADLDRIAEELTRDDG